MLTLTSIVALSIAATGSDVALADAADALRAEDYAVAARRAFAAMNVDNEAAETKERAELYLARALAGQGLSQAAAEHFRAVFVTRSTPALLVDAIGGLEALSRRGRVDERIVLETAVVETDLATLPPALADFLTYHRGLANLRTGHTTWSQRDFAKLTGDTYYAQRTRWIAAVTDVRDGRPDEAAKQVDAMLEAGVDRDMQAILTVMRARLSYQAGDMADAITRYRSVRRTAETSSGELLLERAWAHFAHGEHHDAMGLVHALGAPVHRRDFLPEQYILRGLIYQRFCHYRAARHAVRDFQTAYGHALHALAQGERPESIETLVAAAERQPEGRGIAHVRRAIAIERKRTTEFGDNALAAHLDAVYAALADRTARRYSVAMEDGAAWAADALLQIAEQANLLDYEVGVSLFKPVQPLEGGLGIRQPAARIPRNGDKSYFAFDDEYWTDELENMRFLIQDRCVD